MTDIVPTIGQVVWYWPTKIDQKTGAAVDYAQPHAATISYVHSNELVNLAIVDATGRAYKKENVQLLSTEVKRGEKELGVAEWPPYQKGQAKALEVSAKKTSRN